MSTLEEYFYGNKPYAAHLRIFGSSIYCHVTKDAWKNLDPTIELGIFVGYTNTPHNYQVYLPSNKMTVVCRDVSFNEEKAMRCSLERELQLHAYEEILAPKQEPQDDVDFPHVREQRVESPTHADTSRDGRKCIREANRLIHYARENVGAPTSKRGQRRSPYRYTGYMALMSESVEVDPSSFHEAM